VVQFGIVFQGKDENFEGDLYTKKEKNTINNNDLKNLEIQINTFLKNDG
jgi:hypothetical protein